MDGAGRADQTGVGAIEHSLLAAISQVSPAGAPTRLAQAMRYALFPGGARLRPRLCLAVAGSCGDPIAACALGAAAAIEILHCASLVHDDLPCFDDADERRGKPSVHCAFGERIAVLAGDALIVLAFQYLARTASVAPNRLAGLVTIVSNAVGMPSGIAAGQARECEPHAALGAYHLEKTGALFAAATMAGAAASGVEWAPWRTLGERLGLAYQVADDIRDVAGRADELGKPVGRDLALGRPSAALELGVAGAIRRLDELVAEAMDSVPDCPGAQALRSLIDLESKRFLPEGLVQRAA